MVKKRSNNHIAKPPKQDYSSQSLLSKEVAQPHESEIKKKERNDELRGKIPRVHLWLTEELIKFEERFEYPTNPALSKKEN